MRLTRLLEVASTVRGREKVDSFLRKNESKLSHVSPSELNWVRQHVPEKFQVWFLTNMIKHGNIDIANEDVIDALNWFSIHGKKCQKKDIGQYTIHELVNTYQTHKVGNSKSYNDYDVLYDGLYGKLIKVHTKEGAIELGTGTRWCTGATKTKNQYYRYATIGPIFLFIKQQKKIQIIFEMRACRDSTDRALSAHEVVELFKMPALLNLIRDWLLHATHVPPHVWEYWFNVIKKANDHQAELVANQRLYDPKTSYEVALVRQVLGYDHMEHVKSDVNGDFIRAVNEGQDVDALCEFISSHEISPLLIFHWFDGLSISQKSSLMNGPHCDVVANSLRGTPTYLEDALNYAYYDTMKQLVEKFRSDLSKIDSDLLELV